MLISRNEHIIIVSMTVIIIIITGLITSHAYSRTHGVYRARSRKKRHVGNRGWIFLYEWNARRRYSERVTSKIAPT